jgi:hypothetical protein
MNVLDHLPVATLTFLAGLVLIVLGYISNDVTFNDAFKDVLFLGGGSGGIGYVRNQAGKGVKGLP